jgi:hypothetical protein
MAPAYPKKANPAPPKKMRQFFWDKIPDPQRDKTVWKTVDDTTVILDMNLLLDTFQAAEVKVAAAKPTAPEAGKTVDLVNPTKSKSVFIVMKTIKMTGAAVAADLQAMTPRISLDHLASLRPCLPDQADFDAINQYDGPKELLGECERFYLAIKHVVMLPLRVDLLLRGAEVEKELKEVIKQADVFAAGVKQVTESKALKGMLALVLRVGNFLNGGSPRGGAYGFKIEFLTKLKDVRSAEPGFTFVHLLAKLVEENLPPLRGLVDELNQVIPASSVDFESAKETVAKYRSLVAQCKQNEDEMSMLMVDDGLPKFAEKFCGIASPLCKAFDDKASKAVADFEALKKRFGEDAMTADEFFHIFATFLQHYTAARNENRERAEKAAKKK